MILPCLYNAPVVYYALILENNAPFVIEQHDHYTKQTYRNRCSLLGGNGLMNLVIPVIKEHGKKIQVKEVRIDYDTPWQPVHWKSINAAYASSPFFEYVSDYFHPYYTRKYKFLVDLNCELLQTTLELLNLKIDHSLSESYSTLEPLADIRDSIHPKRPLKLAGYEYTPLPYQQVFTDRYGFVEGLSILDLLFNEGSNASQVLRNSIQVIR